jgi:hypothetical protein
MNPALGQGEFGARTRFSTAAEWRGRIDWWVCSPFAWPAAVRGVFVVVRDRCASNNYPMVITALARSVAFAP